MIKNEQKPSKNNEIRGSVEHAKRVSNATDCIFALSCRLKTLWILALSAFYTARTGLRAIVMGYLGRATRPWVDQELQSWIHALLRLPLIHYRVFNPHQIVPPKGRAIMIMCNHSSMYDIPLSYLAFPKHSMRMLAKKELSRIPLLGKGMKATEFPFVDRHNKQQAIRDLNAVRTLMESGVMMWIAPEGTRSSEGKLGPFKKGGFITAIHANAVIIPIGIRGATHIMPAKKLLIHMHQSAEIHIGKPIDAKHFTLENKDELIAQVRDSMLQLIGEATHDKTDEKR